MVYNGKPSSGCKSCRISKKKCTLERPACARCIKLGVVCWGYRDALALRVKDQTELTSARVRRRRAGHASSAAAEPLASSIFNGGPRVSMRQSSTARTSNDTRFHDQIAQLPDDSPRTSTRRPNVYQYHLNIPTNVRCEPDDVVVQYFLSQLTPDSHWSYVSQSIMHPRPDPCIVLAVKACGTAALTNVGHVPHGAEWSRRLYGEALNLVNGALQDPVKSRLDSTLIAVTMLGFFEVRGTRAVHRKSLIWVSERGLREWTIDTSMESAYRRRRSVA